MSEHRATIVWKNDSPDFLQGRYTREHTWTFDGGLAVTASASPAIVRPPFSNPAGVDPEEAFVAALSSCHMLTFVHLARKAGFLVENYEDEAVGRMTPNERQVLWISSVSLRPRVIFGGERRPTRAEEEQLHHEAHAQCFVSQSVKTAVSFDLG